MDDSLLATSVAVILPIASALGVLFTSFHSKTGLYISLPGLLIVLIISILYICIICPFKEKNTENFSYKKCVRHSLFNLFYKWGLPFKTQPLLFIIAFLGMPFQLILFIIILSIIAILLISIAITIWEFFHHN